MAFDKIRPDTQTGILKGDNTFSTKTASYQMLNDDDIILASGASAAVDITLPDPTKATNRTYHIKATDVTNLVRVLQNGSETIDGETSISLLVKYDAVTLVTDGTNWHIL